MKVPWCCSYLVSCILSLHVLSGFLISLSCFFLFVFFVVVSGGGGGGVQMVMYHLMWFCEVEVHREEDLSDDAIAGYYSEVIIFLCLYRCRNTFFHWYWTNRLSAQQWSCSSLRHYSYKCKSFALFLSL